MAEVDHPPVVPVLHHPELRPVRPSSFHISEFDARMCESFSPDSNYWPSFDEWKGRRSSYVDWQDPQKVVDMFDQIRFPWLYKEGKLFLEGDAAFDILCRRTPFRRKPPPVWVQALETSRCLYGVSRGAYFFFRGY